MNNALLHLAIGRYRASLQLASNEARGYFGRAYAACHRSWGESGDRFALTRDGAAWRAGCNGDEIARGTLQHSVWRLDWHLAHRAVTSAEAGAAFHAGWVERDGRGLMLAGDGGTGKSGACLMLLERGFRLGAEDLTFIEGERIVPFARAIQLRRDDPHVRSIAASRLFPGYDGRLCVEVKEAEAAGEIPTEQLAVALLDPSRDNGPPEQLMPLPALKRLFGLCLRLNQVDRTLFATLVAIASAGRMFVVPCHPDPDDLVNTMEDLT